MFFAAVLLAVAQSSTTSMEPSAGDCGRWSSRLPALDARARRRPASVGTRPVASSDVVATGVERALENFHGRGLRSSAPACWRPARARDRRWPARSPARPGRSRARSRAAGDGAGIAHGGEDRRRALQRVVDHPVEQVLDGPGELADVAAPTMRPQPLSVWNERRTPASASFSSGFCSQAGNSLAMRATSSRASSIYRVSSSGSMLIGLAPMGGWPE